MWPPTSRPLRLALDTMTAAFQRMNARVRRSTCSSCHASRRHEIYPWVVRIAALRRPPWGSPAGTGLRRLLCSGGLCAPEHWRHCVSSTVGDSAQATGMGDRLGLKPGMVVQELGWDNDTDDELRVAVEDVIDADMVDGDYGNVVDAVLLWWRADDGDLVDGLVDALTDLVGGGSIWLLTPKVGRPGTVDAADIAEAAPIAGLSQTTTASVSKDWQATRLVAPKTPA